MLSAAVCFALRPHWRWMVGASAILSVAQLIGMMFMPESPRWLGKMGRTEQMRAVMRKVYKPDHLDRALASLQGEIDALKEACKLSQCERLKTLFTTYGRCLLIGVSISVLPELCGIDTAMYYGPLMMKDAGVTIPGLTDGESSLILNIPLAAANFLGSVIGVLFIEKLGRRGVLLVTTPLMAVCWIVAAIGMAFTGHGFSSTAQNAGGITAIVGIMLFIFTFAIGMGPIPDALNAEIYPIHVIATANSLASCFNWVADFFISDLFGIITEVSLAAQVSMYVALGVFCVLTFAFTWCFVPETAGKPIGQILTEILGKGY